MQALSVRLADGRTVNPTDWTSAPYYTTVEIATGSLQPLPGYSYGVGGQVPGSPGQRLATKRDTNFRGPGGTLMENEEILLFAIQMECYQVASDEDAFFNTDAEEGLLQEPFAPDLPEVSGTNLMRVQRSTYARLKIANTKTYSENVFSWYPSSMGLHRTTGALRSQWSGYVNPELIGQNGNVSVGDSRQFATPHHINGGEAFEFTLEFPFGSIIEPASQPTGSSIPASLLNFGVDPDARIRVVIYAIGPRRRPVA